MRHAHCLSRDRRVDVAPATLHWTIVLVALHGSSLWSQSADVTGSEGMMRWHKITLTLEGPQASESGSPNPFLDYRLRVVFRHLASGLTYTVPGYFAADGDAANSSAAAGTRWRAHLSPDHTGIWTYAVSFRQGPNVAISDDPGSGSALFPYDGISGAFEVAETDKQGRDHRARGRLCYVGGHHLRFAGGEYFLKVGADAPENLLAYQDFDDTPDQHGYRKSWQPHVRDWQPGDPTWKGTKGKGLIGAINYLASKGANAFSFLTYSYNGDDDNVFPYVSPSDRTRFDCSKLDQWEIVFEHADRLGMYLHFKTQETENDQDMDGGNVGTERKLYYRELIARFGHHLALNWNLGEENSQTTPQRVAMAEYFWSHDPYRHPIVIHNPKTPEDLLGSASKLTGFSIQTGPGSVYSMTKDWNERSARAGRPWVCASDEQNPANKGVVPDQDDFWHDEIRKDVLWGNLLAGGGGVEYYFGYGYAHSDLTCEDFRSRDHMWDLSRHALELFTRHEVPFWEMSPRNDLVSSSSAWCLAGAHTYVVYLKNGGTADLDLTGEAGAFEVRWYDPRSGGTLQSGSVQAVNGGASRSLGSAPASAGGDWAILVRPADPERNYPPGVEAGEDQTVMLPRHGDSVTIRLDATVSDDGKPAGAITTSWRKRSGTGTVEFSDPGAVATDATLTGAGDYVLELTASDGELDSSDVVRVIVEPFSTRVTKAYGAADDAYIEGSTRHDNEHLKVEPGRRVSYLKFAVSGIPAQAEVKKATLKLTESGDVGSGTILFHRGSHDEWTEASLSTANAPESRDEVGRRQGPVGEGQTIEVDVTPLVSGNGTYTVIVTMAAGGNDVWFGSDEGSQKPELAVTAEEPEEPAGAQLPGDCNQDGKLDVSDPICLLGYLFLGAPTELPCGDGTIGDPGNGALLDFDGSAAGDGPDELIHRVDLTDAIAMLRFLFLRGAPHVLGVECTPIIGCPDLCELSAAPPRRVGI